MFLWLQKLGTVFYKNPNGAMNDNLTSGQQNNGFVLACCSKVSPILNSNALIKKADRLREARQYEEAIEAYTESIVEHPNALAYSNMGYCLVELKRYEKAVTAFNEAIRMGSKFCCYL
jgi:tetratricopeptide (TPR) repeat protein